MNKIFILGRVGKDAESKQTGGGLITRFSVATNERFTDKNGQIQTKTTWHTVICFGKLAEICAKHVVKGMQVLVEGKMSYRDFEKKDGSKGFSADIIASNVQFLGEKKRGSEDELPDFSSEEIPF